MARGAEGVGARITGADEGARMGEGADGALRIMGALPPDLRPPVGGMALGRDMPPGIMPPERIPGPVRPDCGVGPRVERV